MKQQRPQPKASWVAAENGLRNGTVRLSCPWGPRVLSLRTGAEGPWWSWLPGRHDQRQTNPVTQSPFLDTSFWLLYSRSICQLFSTVPRLSFPAHDRTTLSCSSEVRCDHVTCSGQWNESRNNPRHTWAAHLGDTPGQELEGPALGLFRKQVRIWGQHGGKCTPPASDRQVL